MKKFSHMDTVRLAGNNLVAKIHDPVEEEMESSVVTWSYLDLAASAVFSGFYIDTYGRAAAEIANAAILEAGEVVEVGQLGFQYRVIKTSDRDRPIRLAPLMDTRRYGCRRPRPAVYSDFDCAMRAPDDAWQ